jgi:DNA-directed RNA polymerase specialized sigma24 family protein
MAYPSTRWSQVLVAGGDSPPARAALAWLCERYWDCLQAHVRRRGFAEHDAEDLTQDFLIAIIGGRILDRADPTRGRFRTFLLACLDHHLLHARERQGALKRGGGVVAAPLEETEQPGPAADPVAGFDRDWAHLVVARSLDQMKAQEAPERWHALSGFLGQNGDAAAYGAAGVTLGLSEGAVKVAVHRLRERFRECLRAEIAQTLSEDEPRLIDAELTHLLEALRRAL